MTSDMALMFPIMEISGFHNFLCIQYPLYSYRLYEKNDHVINRALQLNNEMEIRKKPSLNETRLT